MILHAGGQAAIPFLGKGMGCHRQNRKGVPAAFRADSAGGFPSIHHRHGQIHQHHMEGGWCPCQFFQGLQSILSDNNLATYGTEQFYCDQLI
nr:hypothetical protein [Vulcanococcus limneticus]